MIKKKRIIGETDTKVKQENYTAILLKATDYREADKLVRLFTVEGGIVNAVMKGVKKNSAKLKFGAQPFAFCEYNIVEGKGFPTVAGCVPIEDLFGLTQDIDKYTCASVMLEATDRAVGELPDPNAFIMLMKALKATLYGQASPKIILSKLLQTFYLRGGYEKKLDVEENAGGVLGLAAKIQSSTLNGLSEIDCGEHLDAVLKRIVKTFEKHFPPELKSATLLFK